VAEPMIQARGISKDFLLPHLRQRTIKSHFVNMFRRKRTIEVQHALRDIDFDVAQGEFLGVVGRNGSGKSTLLKILAGIYVPTEGHVTVGGRLVPFIELGVGFNAELTGRENVYLNGALLGFSKPEVEEMYDDIVAFAELEDSMDQKLKNYSSGMQVRIAFSVATRARADILLIDEVLAVGDTAFKRKCFEHFRTLKRQGTTIVFVTHDMNLVREFCDRAILIENSRLVADDGPEEIAMMYADLFTSKAHEAQSSLPAETEKTRWGEGDVRYTSVGVPEVLSDGVPLVLDLKAVAERDVDEAAYGFVISDSGGTTILGTDSLTKKQPCGGLSAGEHVHVRWSVPNVFSDGVHFVDVAITDRQGLTIYDSWKEAASFTVVKEETTPYLVTPDTVFSFEREDR
jgi:ABC-2 type transport system ATP-binding protein